MSKYKVTIFTPTYNRGYIIENLYKSLKTQTNYNFEWLVVDDGSTDNTSDLFLKWKKENNKFPIRYIKRTNGGKHRAINTGVNLAEGELFFIVDSDDYLTSNAIEKIIEWESTIDKDTKAKFAGISGNKGYSDSSIVGKTFDGEFIDATSLDRNKYNIFGDKAEVFYTNILKQFKFPEIENEKFITEKVVWYKIANEGYKIRWFNEIIYICDYLDDGLTKSGKKLFIENPKGYALSIKQEILYKKLKLKDRMILYLGYYLDLMDNMSIKEISKNLEISTVLLNITILIWKFRNAKKMRLNKNES